MNREEVGIGFFEGQLRELEAAIGEISGFPGQRVVGGGTGGIRSLRQYKGKLIVEQHPACQLFGAFNGVLDRICGIGVLKENLRTAQSHDLIIRTQLTVLINDGDDHGVYGFIRKDALAVGGGFPQLIVIGSCRIIGEDIRENDITLGIVGAGQQLIIIHSPQLEGELSVFQLPSGELLIHKINLQRGILGIVDIGKIRGFVVGFTVDADDFGSGGAVAVVRHFHHNGIGVFVVDHSGNRVVGDDLLQGVGVDALVLQLIVQDKPGLAHAIGKLRLRDQHIAVIQSKPETGKGNHRAAGGIVELFQHIQNHITAGSIIAVMECNIDLPIALVVDLEQISCVGGDNLIDLQPAIHILVGDGDAEGVQGGIIADAADCLTTVHFQYLIVIASGSRQFFPAQRIIKIEIGNIFAGSGGGNGGPTFRCPLLQLELEQGAVPVTGIGRQVLHSVEDHIHIADLVGNVSVDHFNIGRDRHHAVALLAVFPIGGSHAHTGLRFSNIGHRSLRQTQNLNLLIMLQINRKVALPVGGHRRNRTNGSKGLIRHTDTGEPNMDGKDLVFGNCIVASQIMGYLFGKGQAAFAPVSVDKVHFFHPALGQFHRKRTDLGNVFQRLDLLDRIDSACGHAANIKNLPGIEFHSCLAVGKCHSGNTLIAVFIHDARLIFAVIGRICGVSDHKLERSIRLRGAFGHDFTHGDTGCGNQIDPSIVAQGGTNDETVSQITYGMVVGIHEGNVYICQRVGGIVGFRDSISVQVYMDVACTNVPGAVSPLLRCGLRRVGKLAVNGGGTVLCVNRISAIECSIGLGIAGI